MDNKKIRENIANYVKALMRFLMLNQSQLSKAIGIPQGKLSKIINKKELTNLLVLSKIAQLGGHTMDDVINGEFNFSESDDGKNEITIGENSKINNSTILQGNKDVSIYNNTSIIRRNNYVPNEDDISAEQASILKALVDEIVELEEKVKQKPKSYPAVWQALKRHMKVTYYREIRKEDFEKAEIYLRKWKGRLMKQKTYVNKHNSEFRKQRITAIFTVAKKHFNLTKSDVDDYIYESFGKTSIRELSDSELDKLYQRFMNKKYRRK